MDSTSDTHSPLQPMTVGNVVNTGIRLYSSNLKPYLRVAAIATGWTVIPWVTLVPIVLFYTTVQQYYSFLGLLIPAWLVLLFISLSYSLADSAAIARLAFTELINQAEDSKQARRYTRSRRWSFLQLGVLINLILLGTFAVMGIIALICTSVIFAAMGGADFLRNPASAALVNPTLIVLTVLIFFGVVLIVLLAWLFLGVRLSIADLPLAMEPGIKVTEGISRSWELTGSNFWRLMLILFVTLLITFPLQVVVQLLVGLVQEATALLMPEDSASFAAITSLIGFILGSISSIFLLPLWQAIKAVIYYDLRSRREGLDLELRDWGDRLPPA
ncbi:MULTISPECIES: glycerophosphoryl diester phosphodiesterase membrane domain-containing protein [unclassified Leptolyngbya]|uniref:glycerophosphoryl diester phosphodiesterase membrane domain-containing protein n=1 Tax=unclassified Leptolyngbya TaxID=2650499 RepID=UPI0016835D0E|nr:MULTISPECIES: glycerophosphoryl diester phosphodiesterase membrane domain-containing protein [unclassified Leptolyngbya]MBD1914139.1 glycerophosphoryl diester phosphodiesterase membrane domain-containing protein [Leptolyngbya sp. FACHB-8]MBD2155911.1 glycerophosphoryl diester phosphodiesterase membrane domain-containing protein [Leptolyngbya sp. FACHB-16]